VGGDFNLSDKLYVRGELLYGIRLKNKFEKDIEETAGLFETKMGHGPTVKIGVGYRF
jgi:hypothetical protein